jgi:hypothetical protein
MIGDKLEIRDSEEDEKELVITVNEVEAKREWPENEDK